MVDSNTRGCHALTFLAELASAGQRVRVTVLQNQELGLEEGLGRAVALVEGACLNGNKAMFIGNGGSAAIASHQAVDYWKSGGLTALAFNDSSLLTSVSNDCGYERVFVTPIEHFARPGDLLVAISSSGRSPNILLGVDAARQIGCRIMTLSGFDDANGLRRKGDLNFYVPSHSYGVVEITHLTLLHAILEGSILGRRGQGGEA